MAIGRRRHERLIGVVINPVGSYWLSVIRGIGDAIRRFKDWTTVIIQPEFLNPEVLGRFPPSVEAIIARVTSANQSDLLFRQNRPVVNISGLLPEAPFPLVTVDNKEVGTMAAQYLMGLGLQRLTFVGDSSGFSTQREGAFSAAVRSAGKQYIPPEHCSVPRGNFRYIPDLVAKEDGAPLGVFAVNDDSAASIVSILQIHGVDIPRSAAVLGVDNEELAMFRSHVPLSSIEIPTHGIGYQSGELIMRMLNGERDLPQSTLLHPRRVIARESTDVMAIDDAAVKAAVALIRANTHRALTVGDVVGSLRGISVRTLQRRFLESIGTTLQNYIHSTRVDRIKRLLGEYEVPIKEVAYKSGFRSPDRFTKFFRMAEGMTPQEYRKGMPRRHDSTGDDRPL